MQQSVAWFELMALLIGRMNFGGAFRDRVATLSETTPLA